MSAPKHSKINVALCRPRSDPAPPPSDKRVTYLHASACQWILDEAILYKQCVDEQIAASRAQIMAARQHIADIGGVREKVQNDLKNILTIDRSQHENPSPKNASNEGIRRAARESARLWKEHTQAVEDLQVRETLLLGEIEARNESIALGEGIARVIKLLDEELIRD